MLVLRRANRRYEPELGPRLPAELAALLLTLLAVKPSERPRAHDDRVAIAGLAVVAVVWQGSHVAPGWTPPGPRRTRAPP